MKKLLLLLFIPLISCLGEDNESISSETIATEEPAELQVNQHTLTFTFGDGKDTSFNQIRYLALGDSYTIGTGLEIS